MTVLNAQRAADAGKRGLLLPAYDRSAHGIGIVHIGTGAFFRAHQAAYTDAALAAAGGNWRIAAASLRSGSVCAALAGQDHLYTLVTRSETQVGESTARAIGSIGAVYGPDAGVVALIARMAEPDTRIVTTTVTEKGYGMDRAKGGIDTDHPDIAHDLRSPAAPRGVIGVIVTALDLRRINGLPPFTVLCCDNLPNNGPLLRAAVLAFAGDVSPALAQWIKTYATFPAAMVDRITPAATDALSQGLHRDFGYTDAAAVETEAFSQWVIEDSFIAGRPAWDAVGVELVRDVAPYEAMKLRMLNGAHSMLAYAGFMAGKQTVLEVMADPVLSALVARHMAAAAQTLPPTPGVNTQAYADRLMQRFANPNIAHKTYQIAMDGTQKLPQRIFAPALCARREGMSLEPYGFATAAWLFYAQSAASSQSSVVLQDPRADEITKVVAPTDDAKACVARLFSMAAFVPEELAVSDAFRDAVTRNLVQMRNAGALSAAKTSLARG
ncbi:MAG: mannitol dehydrogenase family protein [Roseobacter sp.]